MKKLLSAVVIAGMMTAGLTGCSTDANIASYNISKAAEQFEITRRIVFYNGITDGYMLTIEGRCSLEADSMDNQLEVTCKTGRDEYKKHYLGLADNIGYFAEQIDGAGVSVYRYKVIFKPLSIIPDVDVRL